MAKKVLGEDVMQAANNALVSADSRRKALVSTYKAEEKTSVALSPLYRPYFGSVMQILLNGIAIALPVDGKSYLLPKSFADEAIQRRIQVDNILTKQQRMADIPSNFETSPGELNMF